MDVLANVLDVTRFTNSTLCSRTFPTPFNMRFKAEQRATFHIVSRGSCWLLQADSEPIQLMQGDVVLLAHGAGHSLGSNPNLPESSWGNRPDKATATEAATATLFCGAYHYRQDGPHPILSLLPKVLRVHMNTADRRIPDMIRMLTNEADRPSPGSQTIITRLMDVLFVYIVRAWLESEPEESAGWLGGLRDPQIGQALSAIHERPAEKWTVQSLAKYVSMSRASFARRFSALVGMAPLTYLTNWRMDLAAQLLREPHTNLAGIASMTGYGSEMAFSKAFAKSRGTPPARYRKMVEVAAT